jgi:multiple sugar transport system ATP-binding protein
MGRLIEVKSVTRRFGSRKVLSDVDLVIGDGELVALVGPSGCGKTTLLRIIAGLETDYDGRVMIDGVDVNGTAPAARDVGMAFQQFALYPRQTVETNLATPLKARRLAQPEISSRVSYIAKRLAIDHLLGRTIDRLSGGEQQRVALGRALIRRPAILLLDEPLASVDSALRRDLRELILSLHEEVQTTTIYVTHDAREAASIADRVIVLEGGEVLQEGTMSDLINDPKSLFVVQHASEVPFNVGEGELISFPEGWIVKAAGRSWLVTPADEKEMYIGPIKFAVHPDHIHLSSGGDGRVERRVKEGGRNLLRVLAGGRVWWVSAHPPEFGTGVCVHPDMKHAFFFNKDGRRLYLKVICIIKKR